MRQSFEIPWEPTAKGRPKFVRKTGIAYTPSETRHAEGAIRMLLMAAGATLFSRDVPLALEMRFRVPRPASAPARVTQPTKRPDLDQYVKLLMDAATGILWLDDAQIVELHAVKEFTAAGPSQMLTVWDDDGRMEFRDRPLADRAAAVDERVG